MAKNNTVCEAPGNRESPHPVPNELPVGPRGTRVPAELGGQCPLTRPFSPFTKKP